MMNAENRLTNSQRRVNMLPSIAMGALIREADYFHGDYDTPQS